MGGDTSRLPEEEFKCFDFVMVDKGPGCPVSPLPYRLWV